MRFFVYKWVRWMNLYLLRFQKWFVWFFIAGMDFAEPKKKNNFVGKILLTAVLTALCILMLKQSPNFNTPSVVSFWTPQNWFSLLVTMIFFDWCKNWKVYSTLKHQNLVYIVVITQLNVYQIMCFRHSQAHKG